MTVRAQRADFDFAEILQTVDQRQRSVLFTRVQQQHQ